MNMPTRARIDLRDVPLATQSALQFVWLETREDAIHTPFSTVRAVQPRPHFDPVQRGDLPRRRAP